VRDGRPWWHENSSQADSAGPILATCSTKSGCSSRGGEELLHRAKAARYADGSAATGQASGLRPVPPFAAQGTSDKPQDDGLESRGKVVGHISMSRMTPLVGIFTGGCCGTSMDGFHF